MQDAPNLSQGGPEDFHPNNLPLQLTSFVGRGREIAEAGRLLDTNRLLTLTGPGGSGKTRLALAVASEAIDRFEDGVWLVELASLSDPDLVPQAVASVLGVQETPGHPLIEAIEGHLEPGNTLLVLDNCEHLVDACSTFTEALLRSCPNLRVLATSREVLGVTGETLFAVPPLSLPDPHRLPAADSLLGYEASNLFYERARAVRPGFDPTEGNALAVAQICYRLDGMPLAIELAAARVRVLSAEQISVRLDDSFRLLAGSDRTALVRQRTLRATMDWSYGLLTREEQTLLGNLSIFAGGFTLGAVEAVYAGERAEEILDLLASLVDKSLVIVEERDGEARYRLLETVRQYGREKLQESGEEEPVRRRHAGFYLALAEEPEPDLREQGAWLLRLGAEQDNFRAALRWTLGPEAGAEDPELGLRLATALGHRRFWAVYGLGEGLAWFERGLERDEAASKSLRAEALSHAGWIANVQRNYDKARGLLEENYSVSKEIGQNQSVAVSLIQLGQFLTMHGSEKERIEELRAETEALLPELSDPQLTGPLLIFLGLVALNKDDYPRTTALLEEGLRLFREIGDPYGTAICCGTLGFVALHQDDVMTNAEVARELFISPRTVNAHMGSVYHKIGSSTRAEAARFATEHDLL